MSFLTGASDYTPKAATGDTKFQAQNLQPAINQGQGGFASALEQANAIQGQQGNLASQLLAQSKGEGPNIADMQLRQATDRNNAQAAGMVASQRGMNPALAARLVAQNQAANNQAAAGQSGLMRAQQQLAAQGQLANVYGQQGQLALGGGQLANQNLDINQQALRQQNQQVIGEQSRIDKINQEQAAAKAAGIGKLANGLLGGAATALAGPLGGALVGGLGKVFGGGSSSSSVPSSQSYYDQMTSPGFADFYSGGEIQKFSDGGQSISDSFSGSTGSSGASSAWENLKKAVGHAQGGKISDFVKGGHVPGKPKHPGNDPRNDVVPAMLSPGEVVLPNTVTKSSDAPDRAKEFMKAIKDQKEPGPKGYAKILELKNKMKELKSQVDEVHKMINKVK